MGICSLATEKQDDYTKFRELFESKSEAKWEIETFEKSVEHINNLN